MTFNGNDFTKYKSSTLNNILLNTLTQGTRFGWEFVNVDNSTSDDFALYKDDWSPKKVIKHVDDHWGYWLLKAELIEKQTKSFYYKN
jgi:hypothetical protein